MESPTPTAPTDVSEPRPLTTRLPGGVPGATVSLRPLLTGELHVSDAFLRRPDGRVARMRNKLPGGSDRQHWLPVPAFLVEHPGAGRLLIDTGLSSAAIHDGRAAYGRAVDSAFDLRAGAGQPVAAHLRELGIDPTSIETVVLSHLHFDQAGAVADFPGATFVVSADEWRAAHARGAPRTYVRRVLDHAFDYRAVNYDAGSIDSFASFGRSFDLFGDGSVMLVATPGHTAGHQSVVLRLSRREVLICGDALLTRDALQDGSVPLFVADEHRYSRSLREIRTYTRMTPSALVIPGRDTEAWARLESNYE